MTFTSRERMRRFLAGQPVDRIPNGLGASETAGLHLLAYDNLKRILGVGGAPSRLTSFMTTALVEPPVLEAMGGDIALLGTGQCPARFYGPGAAQDWKEEVFWGRTYRVARQWQFHTDSDGAIWWKQSGKCPPGGIYFDPVPSTPLADALLNADNPSPAAYHPSHDLPDEWLRALQESARWLHENTSLCICCGETITDLQLRPGGDESWWMRLVADPGAVHEFLGKAVEAGLAQLRLLDQAVGPYADLLMIADDMGDRRGVTIGPGLWREIYKPHYKRLFTEWHRLTHMKVSLHCCGGIADILDDLIDCGVDILNPVQVSASGMEPEALAARFGERIVFFGGAYDAVQTPPHTPADVVYEAVRANIEALNAHGRYLFAAVHNIPGDTPEAHLRAILRAYRDCCDTTCRQQPGEAGPRPTCDRGQVG